MKALKVFLLFATLLCTIFAFLVTLLFSFWTGDGSYPYNPLVSPLIILALINLVAGVIVVISYKSFDKNWIYKFLFFVCFLLTFSQVLYFFGVSLLSG